MLVKNTNFGLNIIKNILKFKYLSGVHEVSVNLVNSKYNYYKYNCYKFFFIK